MVAIFARSTTGAPFATTVPVAAPGAALGAAPTPASPALLARDNIAGNCKNKVGALPGSANMRVNVFVAVSKFP